MAVTVLPPCHAEPEDQGGTAQLRSYRDFAAGFEQAFAAMDLKLLAGDVDVPGAAQLWVMRYGPRGLALTLEPAGGYAPAPLCNTLLSRPEEDIELTINEAVDGKLRIGPQSATDVDLDAAMRGFLAALERFLGVSRRGAAVLPPPQPASHARPAP
jgi:hypothetical protein